MEEPSRPARLLSLDGGGVRGISILYILRQLMRKIDERVDQTVPRPILPCQYFDLIAGTSTGGLIAVMLGTLRMDVETCITKYLELAKDIFPIEKALSRSKFGKLGKAILGEYRFDQKPLESALKRLVSEQLGARAANGEDTLFRFEASKDGVSPECKVFVCATSEQLGKQFRFRSYESSWDVEDDCPIWHACRATSAPPTIFRPMIIGEAQVAYVDGALGYNNPVRSLMDECANLWPSRNIGCIVSIGTGIPPSKDVGRTLSPLFDSLKALATETEKTAREFSHEMRRTYGANQKIYYRFNVREGLGNIGLEEWKHFDRIRVATRDYLDEERSQIDACASQLHAQIIQFPEFLGKTMFKLAFMPDPHSNESDKIQNPRSLFPSTGWDLHLAVENGDEAAITMLLSEGVGVDAESILGTKTPLHLAIERCNIPIVKLLLSKGASIEKAMSLERTALLCAVSIKKEQSEIVELLLNRGCDVNARDCSGMTALHIAAKNGHADITMLLVKSKANVDAKENTAKKSPLYFAAENGHTAVVKILLDSHASIEGRGGISEETPLICAARKGHEAIVQLLLAKGVSVVGQMKGIRGAIPLHLAAENGHFGIAKLLLNHGADVTIEDYYGRTPLQLAVENDHPLITQLLCSRGSDVEKRVGLENYTQLHLAAIRGHIDVVKVLLDIGADIEAKDRQGRSALYFAFDNNHEFVSLLLLEKGAGLQRIETLRPPPLFLAALNGQTAVAKLLLKLGASVSETDTLGRSVIHYAAYAGSTAILALLLANKVQADTKARDGCTALLYASLNGHEDAVRLLLDSGANCLTSDIEGRTSLHMAAGRGHSATVDLLLQRGANIEADTKGYTALHAAAHFGHKSVAQILIDKGAKIDSAAMRRETPLVLAASKGHDDIIDLILKQYHNISIKAEASNALHIAACNGHLASVQRLLKEGVDVNLKDDVGQTALHAAAAYGYQSTLELLLHSKSKLDEVNNLGWLAIHGAALNGHGDIIEMLLEHGSGIGSLQEMFEEDLQELFMCNPAALARLFVDHAKARMLLHQAAKNGHLESVRSQVASGTNVHARDGLGGTALHLAARYGHKELVQVLLNDFKVNPDIQDFQGWTAIHYAAEVGNAGVLQILIGAGALPASIDFNGSTSLDLARRGGHKDAVQVLLDATNSTESHI